MSDWDIFIDSIPWFADEGTNVVFDVGRESASIALTLEPEFPTLARLIRSAVICGVNIDSEPHELYAWDSLDGYRIGWLCLPPPSDTIRGVCDSHRTLLSAFGGIVERFNEPDDTRLINHNSALTIRDASFDASFLQDYEWAFNGAVPIRLSDYYCVAREANGNTTICNRSTGAILLFAPDHSFDDVVPVDGCPEFTLYNIDSAPTLTEWVELIARQWLRNTISIA